MTSATAENKPPSSRALQNLQIALGKKQIALEGLSIGEFENILEQKLRAYSYDARELRGFKTLREVLSQDGDTSQRLEADPRLKVEGFKGTPPDFKSHVAQMHSGVLAQTLVYRRYESDEETTSWKIADEWGCHGHCIDRGTETILLLRRLPADADLEDVLLEATYDFKKVAHKNEHVIHTVCARRVPIRGFCEYFGKNAPGVLHRLLWELATMYYRTSEDLKSQAKQMRKKHFEQQRFLESTSSS